MRHDIRKNPSSVTIGLGVGTCVIANVHCTYILVYSSFTINVKRKTPKLLRILACFLNEGGDWPANDWEANPLKKFFNFIHPTNEENIRNTYR